ncbi:MAG TPA: kynureninase [Noviherbaspirillum sp.]|jgi:kynureninase|uniref:kynureninase n=1 Tax=Noviherbaspirillum sp. TaxID=1926288 RepID=UPI002F95138A
MSITREQCTELDRNDALAALRPAFDLPPGVIYLDGNSLGARPRAALMRAQELIAEEWGNGLIRSWNTAGWFTLPTRLGDKLAPLVGARPGEIAISDSTSINLFKVLAAALEKQLRTAPERKVIVSERSNFPTDLYIAQGLSAWLDRGYRLHLVERPEDLFGAIDASTAVVMLTHVNYRTGHMHDMRRLTEFAHAQGALTVWDLAHSAGAVPVLLNEWQADYAVGCTYKYLNGGPGAPAFLWVAPRHMAEFQHPLSGWWAHASPFVMQPEFAPAGDIRRALCGTQPVVSLAMIECGLDIFLRTDMEAVRAKSLALTDLFIALVEKRCTAHPLELVTPREHDRRGSQVSIAHPHGYAVMQALIARGVIGDYREPQIMRFGFTPLYTRFVDVWDAVDVLADILDNARYDTAAPRDAVT